MSNESASSPKKFGNRPPWYKRQYIVDGPFQHRLIGTLLAIWLANSVFFSFVLYFLYDGHLNQFYELVPRPGMHPLLSLPSLLVTAVMFICVFGLIVLGVIALYMSNQIAGPLYRTKKCLNRVGEGDLAFDLKFREGDFLNDFPAVFNGMLEALRERGREELQQLEAIANAAGDAAEVQAQILKLREKKEALLGLSSENRARSEVEQKSVSVAVH